MLRIWLGILALAFLGSILGHSGVLPAALAAVVSGASEFVLSLICPLWLMTLFLMPGLYQESLRSAQMWFERLRGAGDQIDDLQRKIAHMDKPHHMLQLAQVYLKHGNLAKARRWFESCLQREPEQLDAQYGLAQCRFARGEYAEAAELYERVYATKPEHDYGATYLRLAQSQLRCGNSDRAREVLHQMLRFYPGHPEASYEQALLQEAAGQHDEARRLMEEVVFSVRHSPRFQRRRNRHWLMKARMWLWRHGRG
ncbi:MAG: tetratricopeptide repeat protein [Pirellulales bacterium]|nr:tetratricopeptide repeat protein [Pirellulales bacterium]